jgi:ribokinase
VNTVRVLGNAGLDLRIELPRLPLPGETLLGANSSRAPGGKGLNQAVAAARAGARTYLLAPLGDDAMGAEVAATLASEGLAGLCLPRLPHPTDYSVLMVLPGGENSITGAGPCAAALPPETAARFAAAAGPGDLVLLQGNFTAETTLAALAAATARGAHTLFNPAPLWWPARPLLAHCHIVVANRGEAETLAGSPDPTALRALGPRIAIVTLGAEGCLVDDGTGLRHHPATPTTAIDTTGCGDTFCGVLAARLAQGQPLDSAIAAAQHAAALTATRPGAYAALPRAGEL